MKKTIVMRRNRTIALVAYDNKNFARGPSLLEAGDLDECPQISQRQAIPPSLLYSNMSSREYIGPA